MSKYFTWIFVVFTFLSLSAHARRAAVTNEIETSPAEEVVVETDESDSSAEVAVEVDEADVSEVAVEIDEADDADVAEIAVPLIATAAVGAVACAFM